VIFRDWIGQQGLIYNANKTVETDPNEKIVTVKMSLGRYCFTTSSNSICVRPLSEERMYDARSRVWFFLEPDGSFLLSTGFRVIMKQDVCSIVREREKKVKEARLKQQQERRKKLMEERRRKQELERQKRQEQERQREEEELNRVRQEQAEQQRQEMIR